MCLDAPCVAGGKAWTDVACVVFLHVVCIVLFWMWHGRVGRERMWLARIGRVVVVT